MFVFITSPIEELRKGGSRSMKNRTYIAIDLKSFYASVECRERGLDPLDTHLYYRFRIQFRGVAKYSGSGYGHLQ